jgi:hypothetical protein
MNAKFLVTAREQSDDEEGTLFYVSGYVLNKRRDTDERWTRSASVMLFVTEEEWKHLVTGQEFDIGFVALLPPTPDPVPDTANEEKPN